MHKMDKIKKGTLAGVPWHSRFKGGGLAS